MVQLNSASTTGKFLPSTTLARYSTKVENNDVAHLYSSLFAGIVSGTISSVVCAPLDLLRTRMQVWGDVSSSSNLSGKKMMASMREIAVNEGWRGYFRGLNATLATVPLFWGIYFPLYEKLKQRIHEGKAKQVHPALVHCFSAMTAGAVADIICNPMFVVRTRLQTEALHSDAPVKTIMETANALYREGGIPIFWRGLPASMLGLSHVGVQFPAYEWLKEEARRRRRKLSRDNKEILETPVDLLVASALSKMLASILTYPHEVIRSRMMDTRNAELSSFGNTVKRIWQQEGLLGFYTGLHISIIRVLPNCCITFLTYELLLRYGKQQLQSS